MMSENSDQDETSLTQHPPPPPQHEDDDNGSDDDSDESSEEDDDLVLEGTLMRNPDHDTSSSDDDDEADDEDDDDKEEQADAKPPAKKQKREATGSAAAKKEPRKEKSDEYGLIHVDFTFHDMDEDFFHGIKTLLHSSSTAYAPHSSALSDLMIENVSVGTVISTEGDTEHNVFGFASVLNVTTYGDKPCIVALKELCRNHCPAAHKAELETVLSGKTKRPAGFMLHSRMINLPLELVLVLHQQLVLDLDWAVENAEGGVDEQKSLDFGAFVRIAPGTAEKGGGVIYKYFDDEIFATNAEFVFSVDSPKAFGSEGAKQVCSVIVMTKTGHRAAMKDLEKLITG
jgi:hypothetical protein